MQFFLHRSLYVHLQSLRNSSEQSLLFTSASFPSTSTRASATASLYPHRYPKEILNKKESSFLVTSLRLRLILKRELKYFILFPFGYCPFVRLLYKKFKLWACLVTQKRTKVTYSILFSNCDTLSLEKHAEHQLYYLFHVVYVQLYLKLKFLS